MTKWLWISPSSFTWGFRGSGDGGKGGVSGPTNAAPTSTSGINWLRITNLSKSFWHLCFLLQDVTTTTFPFLEQVSQVWMSLGVYQKSYLAPVHTFYPYMVSSRNFYLKLFPREWRRLSGQVINPQKMAKNQVFFFWQPANTAQGDVVFIGGTFFIGAEI